MPTPSLPSRAPWTVVAVVVAAMLAGACALAPQGITDDPAAPEPGQVAAAEPATAGEAEGGVDGTGETDDTTSAAAATPLTPDLLYNYLLADIAERRGHPDVALEAMTTAARESRDRHIAARAFSLALRAERYETALEMARLLIEVDPRGIRSRLAEIQALLVLDRDDEAVTRMIDLVESRRPELDDVFAQLADLLSRQEDGAAMLPLFGRVVESFADVAEAHYGYAFLASRLGRIEEVLAGVDRALALRPAWEDPALVRLSVLAGEGRDDEFGEFAHAFLERNADAHRVRAQYARHLARQQDLDGAITQLRELTRRQPDDADAQYTLALLYIEREEWARADRALRRHLELKPADDRTRLTLGQVAIERERYDSAVEWLSAVSDENLYLDAQIQIAHALARSEGVDAGLAHLRAVVPASVEEQVRLYLAQEQILRDADQLDQARAVLDAAIAEMPDNGDLLYARGLVTARLGEVEAHERDLRRLIELEPDNAHAYNALGYTLADLTDRYQEALELITRALELQPEDPFILDSMGWVQFRLGNHDQAIEYLERAHGMRADPEIAAHLGEVLWVTGRQEDARKIWERGREQDADNHVLEETLQRFLE